ncbi:DUF1289 domain-containing protein [Oceanimonas sp. CHS3-5]|uniref:DUF1289 domain-containing protein n=1 Tax=Oceanimonas sp. CHS3-5 TaxID=3068186 RepID=UPI00273D3343|nr:DUF1289 domain-containing protein [Oceanimonas sp. CHS3-5]MDP5291984.1 DUF1289 domain-containing protein [Oceanimonas sp. CHS3-5]
MNEPVASPCIGYCRLNEQRVCAGCYRTIDEIIGWRERSEHDKAVILERCAERRHHDTP